MSNFVIEIQAPSLVAALEKLAAALTGTQTNTPTPPVIPTMPATVAPTPIIAPAPIAVPITQPAPPIAAPLTAPAVTPAVNTSPVFPVSAPVAAAPAYQLDDLARAAAQLMDAGKRDDLLALLAQFSVASMAQLPADQYGNFATALRQLGAKL